MRRRVPRLSLDAAAHSRPPRARARRAGLTVAQRARLDAASGRTAPYPHFPYERQVGIARLDPSPVQGGDAARVARRTVERRGLGGELSMLGDVASTCGTASGWPDPRRSSGAPAARAHVVR